MWDTIKEKIQMNTNFNAIDKLHTILLPMMKSTQSTKSQRAVELTYSLQTYKNKDEAHYLIGAMMAINYNDIKSPEKEKILEVLELAKPFEDLYKKYEMIGIEKGIQKGIEEGEKTKALEIARKLIQKGTDPDVVMELTGLSKEELEAIKPSN